MVKFTKEEIAILEEVKTIAKKHKITRFEIDELSINYYTSNGKAYYLKSNKSKKCKKKSGGHNIDENIVNDSDKVDNEVEIESNESNEVDEIDNEVEIESNESNEVDEIRIESNEVDGIKTTKNNEASITETTKIDMVNGEVNVIESNEVDGIETTKFDKIEINETVNNKVDGIKIAKNNEASITETTVNNEVNNKDDKDDEIMTAGIDVVETENNDETVMKNERKRSNLMKKLLTNRYPAFMIFDQENLTETTYEDLLCNCIKLEMNLEKRNYLLLYQYYRIGFFLSKVKERVGNIGFEKQLVTAIIKGCGIANLFCTVEKKYCESTRKKSVKFYNRALRIYKIYSCFPSPKIQIARTSNKVHVKDFIDLGDNSNVEVLISQISEKINSCRNDYEFKEDKNIDDINFIISFVNNELINDINKFIQYPDSPLKTISNVDSLGLVGKQSFNRLVDEGKINKNVSKFLNYDTDCSVESTKGKRKFVDLFENNEKKRRLDENNDDIKVIRKSQRLLNKSK